MTIQELLRRAFVTGWLPVEPDDADVDYPPVPDELRERILEEARRRSVRRES